MKRAETLSGDYTFKEFQVGGSFTGEIVYTHGGREQSLYDYKDKFLKKSSGAAQTMTGARTLSKITATSAVTGMNDCLYNRVKENSMCIREGFKKKIWNFPDLV